MDFKKKKEEVILSKVKIIITTCKSTGSKRLALLKFKKVIIDEAS